MLRAIQQKCVVRFYSIKPAKQDLKKYTSTINLPKTTFPSRLTASKRVEQEQYILENTIDNAYNYQEKHKNGATFVLHDGPPYANGKLHMGHAVNKILKDITLRQHVARGNRVNYIPGWDCHGLPIEMKAMNNASEPLNPVDVRTKSRAFAMDAIKSQMKEFRKWGILANWTHDDVYMTFKPEFIANQMQMFYSLYEQGLIYRDLKPVYWSPSTRTALAEAELEYDSNFTSPSLYVRFVLNKLPTSCTINADTQVYAMIWTTTPWTLPSNQAICFNAELQYSLVNLSNRSTNELYLLASSLIEDFEEATQIKCEIVHTISGESLQECSYLHPIDEEQTALPFFAAKHVQDTKGTGLVHTAPAHGPDDFLVSLQQKLAVKSFVDEAGIYTPEAPHFLRGKSVLKDGNKLVLDHISKDVINLSELQHSYPIDWRSKQPVIIRASKQWFINTDKLKSRAGEALEQVDIYPRVNAEASKRTLLAQLQKRPYWCISRQRAWGVPIPVFYKKDSGNVVTNSALITHLSNLLYQNGSIDFWWSKSIEELIPDEVLSQLECKATDLIKGNDIFDIWFDSGSTWSTVLKNDKVADLYLEGIDQFTGWFQSSLLTSIAVRDRAPYKSLFVHGFTVDEKGHKMSKSLGNVIAPNQIIKQYGVDALRWWVASHGTQHMFITVSDKLLQQSFESLNKVRGILRYLNGVIKTADSQPLPNTIPDASYLNRYLMNSLVHFETEIAALYSSYEYNRVVAAIQNFITNNISAIYVHSIKDRLYCGNATELQAIRFTMTHCYRQLCKAVWPIAPFLIEESWGHYDPKGGAFYTQAVTTTPEWINNEANNVVNAALDLKRLINQQAKEINTWHLSVDITCSSQEQLELLRKIQPQDDVLVSNSELCEILQVGSVILRSKISAEGDTLLQTTNCTLCPRCRRFSLDEQREQELCSRCSGVLA